MAVRFKSMNDQFSEILNKKSPDKNVEKNREMLLKRSLMGVEKYGFTTDTNPLALRDWLQHALEEALDMANYLQAAISKLDEKAKEDDHY